MLWHWFMPRDWRLTAGLASAVGLVVFPAAAQSPPPAPPAPTLAAPAAPEPPETLEMPYEDAPPAPPSPPTSAPAQPPAAPPQAPIAAAPGQIELKPTELPDTRPPLPIRAQRRLVLTGEAGWNGLAGFGPVLTYYATPHIGLDLGLGFSLMGWKAGLRGRYNLLKSPLTPFVGVGFNATNGLGKQTADPSEDPDGDPTRDPVTVNLKDSYLIQGVVGIDYIHRRGFTFIGCVGWAHLLNENNYEVLAGELTAEEEKGFDIAFKGGLVISVAFGYAFR